MESRRHEFLHGGHCNRGITNVARTISHVARFDLAEVRVEPSARSTLTQPREAPDYDGTTNEGNHQFVTPVRTKSLLRTLAATICGNEPPGLAPTGGQGDTMI